MEPFKTTENLIKFLDLAPSKSIEAFLEQHTILSNDSMSFIKSNDSDFSFDNEQTLSTFRNSKATVFKWKEEMKNEHIANVQSVCTNPMRELGYNIMAQIAKDKKDTNFSILVKSTSIVWPSGDGVL